MPAVEVSGLRKSYGGQEAVRGITFAIDEGEVFCLLGPNGAGKTTTVEVLEGYRARDAGEVHVLGFDPQRRDRAFRERIGVVLQHSDSWPNVTVAETLRIYAGYYRHPRDVAEVIELVGLDAKRDARVKTLSGRTEAAARPRPCTRRRPRPRLPGRADDGLRPAGAAQRVGDGARPARARQDDPAHDALPRRSAAARRSRRRPPRRRDRQGGIAGRARRRLADRDPLPRERRGEGRRDGAADARAARAHLARGVRGRELDELEVRRGTLEDVYLDLLREEEHA
jgi:ABC-2 type transport system ATP-binding protein